MRDLTFIEQFSSQYAWNQMPAKRRFRYKKQVNKGMLEKHRLALTLGGVIDRAIDDVEGLQSSDYSTYQIFEKDNLVFKLIDLENIKTSRVGYVPRRGIMSPAYIRLEKTSVDTFSKFYYWFFYGVYINNIFNGMGDGVRQNLTQSDLLEFPIPVPNIDTQKSIADFLDRETTRIDRLIEKKKELILLLIERRKSIISSAISRQKGWHKSRLKFLFERKKRSVFDDDEVVTAFRDGVVTLRSNRREDGFTFAEKEIGYQGVEPGDLVIHTMDGFAGAIGVSDSRGKCSPVYTIAIPKSNTIIDAHFCGYYLRNLAITGFIGSLAKGIRERSTDFRWTDSGNLFIDFPDIVTQKSIADFLDKETEKLDAIAEKTKKSIDLLKEFRSSLITEAVTGRLNIQKKGIK